MRELHTYNRKTGGPLHFSKMGDLLWLLHCLGYCRALSDTIPERLLAYGPPRTLGNESSSDNAELYAGRAGEEARSVHSVTRKLLCRIFHPIYVRKIYYIIIVYHTDIMIYQL